MTCEPVAVLPASAHGKFRGGDDWLVVHIQQPTFTPDLPCAGAATEVFFPSDRDDDGKRLMSWPQIREHYEYAATRYCGQCPIVEACREYAIAHEEYGLWGGLSPVQRKAERKARKWVLVAYEEVPRVFRDRNITQDEEEEE